jgi:hypothetical protein
MRLFTLCACLLAMTGCDEQLPLAPSVALGDEFTLAPGETATVRGAAVDVQFTGVSADSRCPADVVCIQLGEAVVQIRVRDAGAWTDYELRTGNPQRGFIRHRSRRVELRLLQPYPFSNRQIAPGEYRATLAVE